MRDWRAVHGPEKEVFFEQAHVAGREASIDFTHCEELGVTIAGTPFPHRKYSRFPTESTGAS
jgi:hypothetical protein